MGPERDSRVVRSHAEHLESLRLASVRKRELIGAARHVAVWLTADEPATDGRKLPGGRREVGLPGNREGRP